MGGDGGSPQLQKKKKSYPSSPSYVGHTSYIEENLREISEKSEANCDTESEKD